jgi:hypothetical protein
MRPLIADAVSLTHEAAEPATGSAAAAAATILIVEDDPVVR